MQRHPTQSSGRVLVIDDEAAILSMMSAILEDEGYQVVGCASADRALACVRQERPDVVLLDLYLAAERDGWDILRQLRADPSTSALPVIICSSAMGLREDHEPLLRRYRTDVLRKPFDLGELLGLLQSVTREPSPRAS